MLPLISHLNNSICAVGRFWDVAVPVGKEPAQACYDARAVARIAFHR